MAKRLHVLHVIGAPKPGGAETFCVRLIDALRDVCDVSCIVRKKSWMDEQMNALGVPCEQAAFGGMFDWTTTRKIERIIARDKPDVAMAWMNRANRFMPKTNVPVVGRMGGYYDLKYYPNTDHIVGNTQGIVDFVRGEGFTEDKVHYIPNFPLIPLKGFREQRLKMRRELALPDDAYVMLIAGRLHDVKGVDVALDALVILPKQAYLIVAGQGPNEAALKAQAERLGVMDRVRFTGWVADISPLAAASDVWLAPSRFEPLGNIVLDAWAHDLPVVSTPADGPASLITPEKDGLITPIGDAPALAAALTRLMSTPDMAQQLAVHGKQTLGAKYSKEAVVAQYMAFFKKLVAEKGA